MHELSIALSMVEIATEEAARRDNAQIRAIHLKLGKLSGVVKEALLFSYELACEGTPLAGSQLFIEELPVIVFCPSCKTDQLIESIQWFFCPVCGTATAEIVQGKELEIFALEIA